MDGPSAPEQQPKPTEAQVRENLKSVLSREQGKGTYHSALALRDVIDLGKAQARRAAVAQPQTGESGEPVPPAVDALAIAEGDVRAAEATITARKANSAYGLAYGQVDGFRQSLVAGYEETQGNNQQDIQNGAISTLESVYKEVYPNGDPDGQQGVAA